MALEWSELRRRLEEAVQAASSRGATSTRLAIAPPATPEAVTATEEALGRPLPASFRRAVLEFSADVNVFWFLGRSEQPPLKEVFSGDCSWSLGTLDKVDAVRRSWVRTCFPNRRKAYDRVWHEALAFANCGDGSMLGIGTRHNPDAVVFLSHDEAPVHGWVLGHSFDDYLDRSSQLACVGPEGWQLEYFLRDPAHGLDPECENALALCRWLGIGLAPKVR